MNSASAHLAGRHREFPMTTVPRPQTWPSIGDIVGRIGEHQARTVTGHQAFKGCAVPCVCAEDAVVVQ